MALSITKSALVQGRFNIFPGYEGKMPSPGGFESPVGSLITCISLCLFHTGCNVVFYDDTVKSCAGANDTDMITFVGTLISQAGTVGYRVFSECDSRGYVKNWSTGQCLKIVTTRMVWEDAIQYCVEDGGMLVKLETQERLYGAKEISRIYFGSNIVVYTAANDRLVEGTWEWLDGTALQGIETSFNNGDDNFGNGIPANCGRLSMSTLKIYDDNCITEHMFICEQREFESN